MGCLTDWREQPSWEKGVANNSSVSFLGRDARPISVPAAGGADCALCSEIAGGGASQLSCCLYTNTRSKATYGLIG